MCFKVNPNVLSNQEIVRTFLFPFAKTNYDKVNKRHGSNCNPD